MRVRRAPGLPFGPNLAYAAVDFGAETGRMVESTKQFTKQPRRKKEPAKRVTVSPEERKAYEEQIRLQAERHAASLLAPDRDRR